MINIDRIGSSTDFCRVAIASHVAGGCDSRCTRTAQRASTIALLTEFETSIGISRLLACSGTAGRGVDAIHVGWELESTVNNGVCIASKRFPAADARVNYRFSGRTVSVGEDAHAIAGTT